MVYQISYGAGGESGKDCCGQDGYPTIREYWSRFKDGEYRDDFDDGVAMGKQDLEYESFDGLDALKAVEVTQRDTAWEATLDGYKDATKSRGPTEFG